MHRDTEDNGVQVVGFDELNEAVLVASGGEAAPCNIQASTSLEGTLEDHHGIDGGDDDDKLDGAAGVVGAEGIPGGSLEPRGFVKVRGGLKVGSAWRPPAGAAERVQGFIELMGRDLSELSDRHPISNVIVTYYEATCTVNYGFEFPTARAVAYGLFAEHCADVEATDCEVVLDSSLEASQWAGAVLRAKEEYRELAGQMLVFSLMAATAKMSTPTDPAREGSRPMAAALPAAASAAAAEAAGRTECRPSRDKAFQKTKKKKI
jgi:hypothetical protein